MVLPAVETQDELLREVRFGWFSMVGTAAPSDWVCSGESPSSAWSNVGKTEVTDKDKQRRTVGRAVRVVEAHDDA